MHAIGARCLAWERSRGTTWRCHQGCPGRRNSTLPSLKIHFYFWALCGCLDSLKLSLQAAVSHLTWVPGRKLGASGGWVNICEHHLCTSPQPQSLFIMQENSWSIGWWGPCRPKLRSAALGPPFLLHSFVSQLSCSALFTGSRVVINFLRAMLTLFISHHCLQSYA